MWAALVFGCTGALLATVLGVGSAVAARHRAASAADLGALAGAARAWSGEATACAAAGDVIERMESTLTSCTLDGLDITVHVERPVAGFGRATATARAGPVRG